MTGPPRSRHHARGTGPDYLGALQALRGHDASLVAVPIDACGLRTDILDQRLEGGLRPKLVYVVANFHNPPGTTLSADRRRQATATHRSRQRPCHPAAVGVEDGGAGPPARLDGGSAVGARRRRGGDAVR